MRPSVESVSSLAKRWSAGDRSAGDELIRRHDDWIVSRAKKWRLRWESLDDVCQALRRFFLYQCKRLGSANTDGLVCHSLSARMQSYLNQERIPGRYSPPKCEIQIVSHGDEDDPDPWDRVTAASSDGGMARRESQIDVMRLMSLANLTPRERRIVEGFLLDSDMGEQGREMGLANGSVKHSLDMALKKMAAQVRDPDKGAA